jgi:hypothetical protein
MIEDLRTIAALLHKYGARRARDVEALLEMAEARDPNLGLDVCGEAMWGEDGGLWDSGPQVLQRKHDDADTCRRDELVYRAAFQRLAEAIERDGMASESQLPAIREVARTFAEWERDGL